MVPGVLVDLSRVGFALGVDFAEIDASNGSFARRLSLHVLVDPDAGLLRLDSLAVIVQVEGTLVGLKHDARPTGVDLHHVLVSLGACLQVLH